MRLRGELQTMPLSDIFQWLGVSRKTGVLEITALQECRKFYLNFGAVATATSDRYHTTDNAANVRSLMGEALQLSDGGFDFTEAPLPPEILAIDLRLDIQQLLPEVLLAVSAAAERSDAAAPPAAESEPAAFRPADEFRLAIIGRLLQNQFDLPVLPTVVRKVLDITQREDFSLRTLCNVIRSDQVLTAQIIRHANSAIFAAAQEVSSLPDAIQRLGAQVVTNIVLACALQSLRSRRDIFLAQKKMLWKHSLACALLARTIAASVRAERDVAFLCALMMDFGKIVLLSMIQEVMTQNPAWQRTETATVEAVLQSYHTKIGSLLGEKWNLPPAVLESIRRHHSLRTTPEHVTCVAIASLSDTLITYCTRKSARSMAANQTSTPSPADEAESLSRITAATMLGLSAAQMQAILDRGPECLTYAQDFLVQ